ncbi:MAG: flagellar hook-length control protein FliK [Deltaproteobacteria bacterium]|nr:flagellar hook-length control protein FliK [Deltaproteobacteria bacterium]
MSSEADERSRTLREVLGRLYHADAPSHRSWPDAEPGLDSGARVGSQSQAKRAGESGEFFPWVPSRVRDYPALRAMCSAFDTALNCTEPRTGARASARDRPAPVPGTFFPAPRRPLRPPEPAADLDGLLSLMADGLLFGDDGEGNTQIRVTLKDEFFAGTELWIRVGAGRISATLIPPDRETYFLLNGQLDGLRDRLGARGLVVEELSVEHP